MSNRKLQEFGQYHYGQRGVLCPGDLFRVSAGPYYQSDDGSKTLMAERGKFKFVRYCEKGSDKWIEARQVGGGMVVLWVGKAMLNPYLPSFKRRPYKVQKITGRAAKSVNAPARTTKAEGRRKIGGAKGMAKAKARAGSTSAARGGAAKHGENGVERGAGRAKGLPSTSGSTSI